jgi:hypothetical protein
MEGGKGGSGNNSREVFLWRGLLKARGIGLKASKEEGLKNR